VSMGANAATKLYRVIQNCYSIIGIELLNAAQAFEFRKPLKSSEKVEALYHKFRKEVNFIKTDLNTSVEMKKAVEFVKRM